MFGGTVPAVLFVDPLCVQSTAVLELLNRMSEVDSDMADITQDAPGESILEEWESGMWEKGSRLGNVTPSEHDSVSASSQIASSLGINPHTLQVTYTLMCHLFNDVDGWCVFPDSLHDGSVCFPFLRL